MPQSDSSFGECLSQDIKWRWRWQWVPTNDEVAGARPTWTDVDPRSVRSLPLTITMQNCSQVSTTVLTVLVDDLEHSHRRFCCTVSANERSYIIGTTQLNAGCEYVAFHLNGVKILVPFTERHVSFKWCEDDSTVLQRPVSFKWCEENSTVHRESRFI